MFFFNMSIYLLIHTLPLLICLLTNHTSNPPFTHPPIHSSTFHPSTHTFKVALVDLLRDLNIEADGMIGHSVGELGCAYADGGLSAEETILAAFWRGTCVVKGNLPPGKMAAVGRCSAFVVVVVLLLLLL